MHHVHAVRTVPAAHRKHSAVEYEFAVVAVEVGALHGVVCRQRVIELDVVRNIKEACTCRCPKLGCRLEGHGMSIALRGEMVMAMESVLGTVFLMLLLFFLQEPFKVALSKYP